MKIDWYLSCSLDKAKQIIKENIDGPLVPPFMGKNFQGFRWGNSFTIWNKHEGIGNRTAVVKIKLTETANGTKLEGKTLRVFPSNIAPSSPKFYWFLVPVTILLWLSTAFSMVFDEYIFILKYVGPLTAIGILLLLLGHMKMLGSGNLVFLEKFLHQTFIRYKKG
jgi:hypothetical protein